MVCPAIFYQLMLSLSKVFPSDNLSSPLEFLLWEVASFTLGVETEQEEREEAEEATACLQRACDPATFPLLSAKRAGRTKTSWVCHPLWQQSRIHFCWCYTCSVGITSPYYSGFHHDRDAETSLTCCLKPFIFCLVKSLGRNELGSTLRPHLYKSFERFPDKGKPTELRGKQKIIQYCNYELQAWPLSCSMYLWKVGGQHSVFSVVGWLWGHNWMGHPKWQIGGCLTTPPPEMAYLSSMTAPPPPTVPFLLGKQVTCCGSRAGEMTAL